MTPEPNPKKLWANIKNMKSNAQKWLNDEISLGKLLQLEGCQRPSGDDLAGSIANAFSDKAQAAYNQMEAKRARFESEYKSEVAANEGINSAASAAGMRAMTEAMSIFRLQFGKFIQ